jgi:flagellar motor component MotA
LVREQMMLRQLALNGVLGIQEGMNPKLLKEQLSEFLHAQDAKKKK